MTQKELKEIHRQELNKFWNDKKMTDHCLKTTNFIVRFDDGTLYGIEKPTIEKDFCFGYHLSHTDSESYDNAQKTASNAKSNTDYFMYKNLKGLKETVKCLKENIDNVIVYAHYTGQHKDLKLRSWTTQDYYNSKDYAPQRNLTKDEVERLISGYEEVIKDFTKRLQTYLKRYGMTKVRTWTYWIDA